MTKRVRIGLFLLAASTGSLWAQGPAFDTSGNGLLSGTYYFRHVLYFIDTNEDDYGITGDLEDAVAVFGMIDFHGDGTYSIESNATAVDAGLYTNAGLIIQDPLSCYLAGEYPGGSPNCTTGVAVTGTYAISASGFGFMSNPIVSGDNIFGTVSANGVFVASSTETGYAYNDLFIAAQVPSPTPTDSFFSGSYSVVGALPFYNGSAEYAADVSFQMSPNGGGIFSEPLAVSGYFGGGGTTQYPQSTGASYSFSGGYAAVTFPSNSNANFFPGGTEYPEYLYFSPDGNFFFGGSPTGGFDMLVGVRNSGSQNFGNPSLYYDAGIFQDETYLGTAGLADFDGYYGSFNVTTAPEPATGESTILAHQRVSTIFNGLFGSTFMDSYPDQDPFVYEGLNYTIGAGGAIRIGQGVWPSIGIDVGLQAPTFTGPSVYINPTAIVNAANFAPFTAGVSNGEYVYIGGSDLAPAGPGVSAPANIFPLPTILNGVQVFINGEAAALNYVSSSAVVAIVPFGSVLPCAQVTTLNCVQFTVVNNGNSSNTVTELAYNTTPGVFTGNSGLGYAYAADATGGYIVNASTPAEPGDYIQVYVSGLGTVFPAPGVGEPGPLSAVNTTNTFTAYINGESATVSYAGLAPTLAGVYQMNLQIPSDVAPISCAGLGQCYYLEIAGNVPVSPNLIPDSMNFEALIPIGSGSTASAKQPGARARTRATSSSAASRIRFCSFGANTGCQRRTVFKSARKPPSFAPASRASH